MSLNLLQGEFKTCEFSFAKRCVCLDSKVAIVVQYSDTKERTEFWFETFRWIPVDLVFG